MALSLTDFNRLTSPLTFGAVIAGELRRENGHPLPHERGSLVTAELAVSRPVYLAVRVNAR